MDESWPLFRSAEKRLTCAEIVFCKKLKSKIQRVQVHPLALTWGALGYEFLKRWHFNLEWTLDRGCRGWWWVIFSEWWNREKLKQCGAHDACMRQVVPKTWRIPRQQKFREMIGAHLASPIRGELGYAHRPQFGSQIHCPIGNQIRSPL